MTIAREHTDRGDTSGSPVWPSGSLGSVSLVLLPLLRRGDSGAMPYWYLSRRRARLSASQLAAAVPGACLL